MLIFETASFKCRIVAEDPSDRSTRRILNFGHTIGHALESLSARNGEANLLHGQAVASGMICEAWLSHRLAGLPESEMKEIVSVIKSYFDLRPAEPREFDELVRLVDFDKKKSGKRVVFSLLRNIGKHSTGIIVNNSDLIKSFEFYNEIIQQR
jgi:3-dehydroquinate synthase